MGSLAWENPEIHSSEFSKRRPPERYKNDDKSYTYSVVRLMIRDLFMENERGGLILPRLRKKGIKC